MLPVLGLLKYMLQYFLILSLFTQCFSLPPSLLFFDRFFITSFLLLLSIPFIVLGLVKKGADATVADNKGRTALHFAACRGDANMGTFSLPLSQITSPSLLLVLYSPNPYFFPSLSCISFPLPPTPTHTHSSLIFMQYCNLK